MKVHRRAFTAAALTWLPVCLSAREKRAAKPSSQDDAKREVQAAFDRYIDGWKLGDVEALSHVYAADSRVTAIWPDPTVKYPAQGWPNVAAELNRVFSYGKGLNMLYKPRHVELYGDIAIIATNWDWIENDLTTLSAEDAKLAEERRLLMKKEGFGNGQATFVFQRRASGWVLVHEHASVEPVDRPTE
jgi:ketosteroid isomerase-like protein